MLQQILFLSRTRVGSGPNPGHNPTADFEKPVALNTHREVLQQDLARKRTLLGTIDRTVAHLKGEMRMESGEMFEGFSVSTLEEIALIRASD